MFNEEVIPVFRTTFNQVIKNLSTIKDCPIENLEDVIEEKFANYNYEGEEDIVGYNTWPDISKDGDYKLLVKINHEYAYEITLHTTIKDKKATVYNVL